MTLSLAEFGRLKKLMSLSTSSNDAEALGALRAANRILKDNRITWDLVFSRTITVISEMSGTVVHQEANGLDETTFELALSNAEGSFRDLLHDIYEKYQRGEPLSPRQREVVTEAASRAAERRPAGRFR